MPFLNCPEFPKICFSLIYTAAILSFSTIPWSGNLKIYWWESGYQCQVGSKWLINIIINLKTRLLFMLIYACTIFYRLVECPYRWMKKIIKKIYELVGEGVHQIREMERHLKIFVKNELFKDSPLPVCLFCFSLSIKIFRIKIRKVTTTFISYP